MPGNFRPIEYVKTAYKNSPWVVISVAGHALVFAILGAFVISQHVEKQDNGITAITLNTQGVKEPDVIVLPPEPLDIRAVPKNQEAELVDDAQDIYMPASEVAPDEDLYVERGDPTGMDNLPPGATGGTSIGVGTSGGHPGSGPSSGISKRRVGGGGGHGRPGGPTQGTEKSVLEGLRWLARHQNDDGSWGAQTLATHCTTDPPCVTTDPALGSRFDAGMTGIALLAFLGQGLSTDSKIEIVDTALATRRSAGEVVLKGVKWLVLHQGPDGSFSGNAEFEFPENDTLPMMAVCEAYGLSRNPVLRRPAQSALDFVIAAQKRRPDGSRSGWGRGSHADLVRRLELGELDAEAFAEESQVVDPTVTCWTVMAIQSARTCGLTVPDDVLAGALAYVVEATGTETAEPGVAIDTNDKFVFHEARHQALGMLTRTFAGGLISDPYLERGARELALDVPEVTKDGLSIDFYYWYFGTLALNQYDGPDSPRPGAGEFWTRWNKGLVDSIIQLQDDSARRGVCSRGGWLQKSRGNRDGMELRNTALNVMTLEVYYRFENVFGSATRGQ